MNPAPQIPLHEVVAYLRELAQRLESGEEIKTTILVDANGRADAVTYGHKNFGEALLQLEDRVWVQRLAFLLPQLLPQVQRTAMQAQYPSTH